MKTLVYFAPVEEGGLAKYAVCQAKALANLGVQIHFLGPPHFQSAFADGTDNIRFTALPAAAKHRGRVSRVFGWIARLRREVTVLEEVVKKAEAKHLLISSYAEYFAPFWAGKLRRLRKYGVKIGTVVHDPVRDFRIGPHWWHQYCISSAYSFVDVGFVHDATEQIDLGKPKATFAVVEVPHGPYDVPPGNCDVPASTLRDKHGIPQDAFVVLSFGHIRDGKNLNLLIQALKCFPSVHLLAVGREQSSSQRPVAWYQQLAQQHGVQKRCHWVNRFVEDREVEQFFRMSNLVALLYSRDFHSASGVLNNVAQFELPVLCSSGGGPLRGLVENYNLGQWVAPDDVGTVQMGIEHAMQMSLSPDWVQYRMDNSWQENARLVMTAMRGCR